MTIMKILLLGANGYVGSRIYQDLKDKFEIVGTYHHTKLFDELRQLDITDYEAVRQLVSEVQPDVIIHPANYASRKDVINNEANFLKLNRDATKSIVDVAKEQGIKLIFFSSMGAENPGELYPQTKLESEAMVKSSGCDYLIIRPSIVYGMSPNISSEKKPYTNLVRAILDNTPITIDTSWQFQPTYIGHISQVIEQTIVNNIWNRTVRLFTDHVINQYALSTAIAQEFGTLITPIDLGVNLPPATRNQDSLADFVLTPHTYEDLVKLMSDEIASHKQSHIN